MYRRYLYGIFAFALGFGILSVSLLRSSSSVFAFSTPRPSPTPVAIKPIEVNYALPYPGKILPGDILWPFKAARDRILLIATVNHLKRAEMALSLADKRLVAGEEIVKSGDQNLGFSVINKAGKYLEMAASEERNARQEGQDTFSFLFTLANSSLKHRELLEKHFDTSASAEVKMELGKTINYSNGIYRDAKETLISAGKEAPKSPFDGQ